MSADVGVLGDKLRGKVLKNMLSDEDNKSNRGALKLSCVAFHKCSLSIKDKINEDIVYFGYGNIFVKWLHGLKYCINRVGEWGRWVLESKLVVVGRCY